MWRARPLAFAVVWTLVLASAPAAAEQPADWMFQPGAGGSRVTFDYLGSGAQLSYNHTEAIYGKANSIDLGVSALTTYPLGQMVASTKLRVLFLELGGALGYRTVWRSLRFARGQDGSYCEACDRDARGKLDKLFGSGPGTDAFVLAEGHATLFAPLNDHVLFVSTLSAQFEGRAPRSFDWWYGTLHDRGVLWNWPTRLFFHHRDWGGFAPYVHRMSFPQAGGRRSLWAYGFQAVRRLGLLTRDDLVFLTFLARPGDREFGHHTYYGPIRALLIYRAVLEIR